MDDLPCIYFSANDEDLILQANEPLCRHLGYGKEDLVGNKLQAIFTLSTRIFQQTHLFPLLRIQGSAEEIYITLLMRNGDHLPVLINATRVESATGTMLHFAGIVVTKRKKFEEEIIAAKKAAQQALQENTSLNTAKRELQEHAAQVDQQMAQISRQNAELRQFSQLVTHDLQEPLRKLGFFSGMLEDEPDVSRVKELVARIRRVAEQMRELLYGLQQYTWLSDGRFEMGSVDINTIVAVAKAAALQPGKADFIFEGGSLPPLEANAEQMAFLLQQLFANALRFRSPGRPLSIKVFATQLRMNKFRELAGNYEYAEYLKIQVIDNGVGFERQYEQQAFELFRKLHPQSGAGIGLSLCRKIVQNHHGTISLESRVDGGTTVDILLPLHQQEKAITSPLTASVS